MTPVLLRHTPEFLQKKACHLAEEIARFTTPAVGYSVQLPGDSLTCSNVRKRSRCGPGQSTLTAAETTDGRPPHGDNATRKEDKGYQSNGGETT